MKPDYFTTKERVDALQRACESWIGTPFRKCSSVKGRFGGIDCGGGAIAVNLEAGAIAETIVVTAYEVNHADYSEESILKAYLDRPEIRKRLRPVDQDEALLDGDLVFPRVGRTEHHLAVYIRAHIYHAVRPIGWVRQQLSQFKNRHRSRYRFLEA